MPLKQGLQHIMLLSSTVLFHCKNGFLNKTRDAFEMKKLDNHKH